MFFQLSRAGHGCIADPLLQSSLPRLISFFADRSRRVIVQQGVEDMFNVVKSQNRHKSNTTATEQFCMAQPLDSRLLSTKHRYREVDAKNEVPPRQAGFDEHAFKPLLRKSLLDEGTKSCNLDAVSTFGDPTWYTTGAGQYFAPYTDLEVLRQHAEHGSPWPHIHKRGFCKLIRRNMIFKRCTATTRRGTSASATSTGRSPSAGPCSSPGRYVLVCEDANPKFFLIVAPERIRAAPVRMVSPLSQAVARERERIDGPTDHNTEVSLGDSAKNSKECFVAEVTGPVCTLLELAAKEAFYDLPLSFLKEVGAWRGADFDNTTMLGVLEKLICRILVGITEDALIKILELRGMQYEEDEHISDLIHLEYITDLFDKSFQDDLETEIKSAKEARVNWSDYTAALQKFKACCCNLICVFI